MRRAALIVLAWNRWELTRRCLDSLLASEPDAADIIVVDNGSGDETPTALAAYADRVHVVRLPENLGFVRGMNAGIAAAQQDDDVVLLNNDLLFTQHDWLGRLRDAAYAAPEADVLPVDAHTTTFAPCSTALDTANVMPRSLNDPVGFIPSTLTQMRAPVRSDSGNASTRGVPPSPSVTIGVDSLTSRRSAYSRITPRHWWGIVTGLQLSKQKQRIR